MSDKHDEHKEPAESHGSHGSHGGGAHGGGAHEEHEGAPEWLISFADNVTLMMGFFVVLLAITMQSAAASGGGSGDGKGNNPGEPSDGMLDTVIAIRDAFNNPVQLNSMDPKDLLLVQRLRQQQADAERHNAIGPEHKVQSTRRGDSHDLGGTLPFEPHSDKLNEEATRLGSALAKQFRGTRVVLEIRGHASAEEDRDDPDKGMRLSFERALSVAKFLASEGLDWRQLRLVANSDSDRVRPLAYDGPAHRENAHVEVVATGDLINDYRNKQVEASK